MAMNIKNLQMWGRFDHSLDEKGRVILPAKFRDQLGANFTMTAGINNHVRIYPKVIWGELEQQLSSRDVYDELDDNVSTLQRLFANSETASLDAQFRVTIPRFLRNWARIGERDNDSVIITGNGARIEIWSYTMWEIHCAAKLNADIVTLAAEKRKSEIQALLPEIHIKDVGEPV